MLLLIIMCLGDIVKRAMIVQTAPGTLVCQIHLESILSAAVA